MKSLPHSRVSQELDSKFISFTSIEANRDILRPKKINVLFPKTSKYFYGSVGRQKNFFINNFLYRKSMKIIQN